MNEPSGRAWCARYPGSTSLDDLSEAFRPRAKLFLDALRDAIDSTGMAPTIIVSATHRPRERAYLMHWCCKIADGSVKPESVPPLAGVDIDWTHGGMHHNAIHAARAMKATYVIAFPPSLTSRHITGDAIDMSIVWQGNLKIRDRAGSIVTVIGRPNGADNRALHSIGAEYGVYKLATDRPHWSVDGH